LSEAGGHLTLLNQHTLNTNSRPDKNDRGAPFATKRKLAQKQKLRELQSQRMGHTLGIVKVKRNQGKGGSLAGARGGNR
jgi:hypothetical protein